LAPFDQAVSEEKIFLTLTNQKQELPLVAIFVGGMGRNETYLGVIAFFCQIFKMLIPFILYFKNYKR
jgi:hypothetical protein